MTYSKLTILFFTSTSKTDFNDDLLSRYLILHSAFNVTGSSDTLGLESLAKTSSKDVNDVKTGFKKGSPE